jgi:hypothetical protein
MLIACCMLTSVRNRPSNSFIHATAITIRMTKTIMLLLFIEIIKQVLRQVFDDLLVSLCNESRILIKILVDVVPTNEQRVLEPIGQCCSHQVCRRVCQSLVHRLKPKSQCVLSMNPDEICHPRCRPTTRIATDHLQRALR